MKFVIPMILLSFMAACNSGGGKSKNGISPEVNADLTDTKVGAKSKEVI